MPTESSTTPTAARTTATATPVPTAKTPRFRAAQDQKIANAITEAGQIIDTITTTTELSTAIASRGYDKSKLTEGKRLQQAAQESFSARQSALATQKEQTSLLEKKEKKVRQSYSDFRETVRAIFSSKPDHAALGIDDKVPADAQKLVTTARASYSAASEAPFSASLSKFGWSKGAINSAQAELDGLSAAESSQKAAIGAAVQARADRDAAFDALDAWMKQFRRIAKVALREEPGLKRMIGL